MNRFFLILYSALAICGLLIASGVMHLSNFILHYADAWDKHADYYHEKLIGRL